MELWLGTCCFSDGELPAELTVISGSRLRSVNLIDGTSNVLCQGVAPRVLAWNGVLIGEGAAAKATLLTTACDSQVAQLFIWNEIAVSVFISRVVVDFRSPCLIDYSLICIESDNTSPALDPLLSYFNQDNATEVSALLGSSTTTVNIASAERTGLAQFAQANTGLENVQIDLADKVSDAGQAARSAVALAIIESAGNFG